MDCSAEHGHYISYIPAKGAELSIPGLLIFVPGTRRRGSSGNLFCTAASAFKKEGT